MKTKTLRIILLIEAVLCMVIYAPFMYDMGIDIVSYPFSQVGEMLRKLSLSGSMENVIAIVLYVVICLLPLLLMLPTIRKKRKIKAEDMLPFLTSAIMFAVMYFMINPQFITDRFHELSVGKFALSIIVWTAIITYVFIKLSRTYLSANSQFLKKKMSVWLGIIAIIYVFSFCGIQFGKLIKTIKDLHEFNGGGLSWDLITTYGIQCLDYAASGLMTIFCMTIVIRVIKILQANHSDRADMAGELAKFCAKAFAVALIAQLSVLIIQAFLATKLLVVTYYLSVPVTELAIILIVLVVSRIMAENKKLKEDNDLFI